VSRNGEIEGVFILCYAPMFLRSLERGWWGYSPYLSYQYICPNDAALLGVFVFIGLIVGWYCILLTRNTYVEKEIWRLEKTKAKETELSYINYDDC
jgi:hypothetical protein